MKSKNTRLETSLRRYKLIRVCVMVDDTINQIIKDPSTPKPMLAQAEKVYRWNGECLDLAGIKTKRDTKLSARGLREYAELAERFNTMLQGLPKDQQEGAHYMAVWSLIMDVWCSMREYRVECVRRLDQTFGTLTKMILGVNNPDDSPAAEAGTQIYMEMA